MCKKRFNSYFKRWMYLCFLSLTKTKGILRLFFLIIYPLIRLFNCITQLFDHVIFPSFRSVVIKEPIFIIGYPRSGTTFLHRLLTKTGDFASFRLYQLFFPSILGQKLIYPIMKLLDGKIKSEQTEHHPTGPFSIEEEDVLFFFQCLDSIMVYTQSPYLLSSEIFPNHILHDKNKEQTKNMAYFKSILKRLMYQEKKDRYVAKMSCGVTRIQSIHNTFPDAKIIYIVRNPIDQITSFLSLVTAGWKVNRPPLTVIGNKIMGLMEIYYDYGLETFETLPSDALILVKYETLRGNLGEVLTHITNFTQLKVSDQLAETFQEKIKIQKSFERSHNLIPLEEFGITNERVYNTFKRAFQKYGYSYDKDKH